MHQQITEAVLATSLDVDDVIAKISYEQARVSEVQDRLSNAKNSKANALALTALIVGPGSNAIDNGIQFDTAAAKAANWIQVVGGTGCIVLAILAMREQGGASDLGVAPNMLAPLFGREPEVSSVYPQDVWTYLNTVPAANPRVQVPWKEELINE